MTIVFEPLVSSPETLGTATASLPRITSFGSEVPNYGVGSLPTLTGSSTGVYGTAYLGDGLASLPLLRSLGFQAAGGYGVGYMPTFASNAIDDGAPVPQGSDASGSIPTFSGDGAGFEGKVGAAEAVRLALRSIGFEAALSGDTYAGWGVSSLPSLFGAGAQTLPTPTLFASLVTASPYMVAYTGLLKSETLSDTVGAIEQQNVIAATALHDQLFTLAYPANDIIKCMTEQLALTGSTYVQRDRNASVADALAYDDAMAVIWQLAAAEGIDFVGSVASDATKFAALIDVIHALGTIEARKDAMAAAAEAIALNTLMATGWAMTAIDTIEFQEALAGQLRALGVIIDTAGFGDTPSPAMRISAVVTDAFAGGESLASTLEAFEQLHDEMLFYTTLRLGADEYAGWVINEGAISEYKNYPFNGFVKFNGRYFGTSETGLYLLEGADDDGAPIDARIRTALMDFGTGLLQRAPDVYIAMANNDKLVLKVITTGRKGETTEHVYTATVRPGDDLHNGRIKIGKGLESRYWQFELANVDGGAFELDELAFKPVVLSRRI